MAMFTCEGQHDRDDAREFLHIVRPFALTGDLSRVADYIARYRRGGKLFAFLTHIDVEVRRAAAMALALGDKKAIEPLVAALHDSDVLVCQRAEDALWAIWFRAGNNRSCCLLKCGARHLKHGNLDTAIEKFSLAIETDPEFAEAYNQRAIAYYLAERYHDSIHDCRRALERMPRHFGALAGMGHCHAQLGNLSDAQQCYHQALVINPRMEGIAASLEQIHTLLEKPAA